MGGICVGCARSIGVRRFVAVSSPRAMNFKCNGRLWRAGARYGRALWFRCNSVAALTAAIDARIVRGARRSGTVTNP
ncbi:hypothetical protein C0Z18_13230 [Trinickia dabaoshanensis]|uniref:Uncharacterized protein n=1 Tax=Trinickia dabaoshanensis TaxID=564714 RepID=A0A2N7VRK6_9BURK|nr:hypothetical protein C0Z18_13230 [Trinickia dabaoshanensis]